MLPLRFCVALAILLPPALAAQTLNITNGTHTYSALTNNVVTMTGQCELRITASSNPIPGCIIHLNSPDAFFILQNIRPSTVVASHLLQLRINGAVAVADSNCRVVQYGLGAVVIPHPPSFQPLHVFSGPHFTGSSMSLSPYVYYRRAQLGALNADISSFRLKRGYTVTLAENENGSGFSRNYVAQDGDMEVSVLPGELENRVRFVYIVPWRWVGKKGACDVSPADLQADWWYNWDINQSSTRDREYVAIKQQPHWPSLNQNWQALGVNHLSGFNEPNNPVEDAYKNLTPPGSVDDAVARWLELLGAGLRVGAPAVTDGGQAWLTDFMNKAEAAGMRVDYVPIHYYRCYSNNDNPAGAATQLYNFLKGIYDVVKRPLWVTEFNNGANWTGCADPSYSQNASVVQAMIQRMDETPWVERYAIYSKVEYMRQTHYDEGGLTPMGVMYRNHVAPLAYLQGLHNNGTRSFAQIRFEGNTRDTSGYANNGVASGNPVYTNGVRGQAIVFDGANTVVTLPPNVAENNAFTFAAWVNWGGGGNWQRIFDFGNSTTHYLFLTARTTSGTLRFAMRNGGGEQIVETSGLPVNQWRHVAVTLSGNTARIYVNGALAASNTGVSISPASFRPRVNFLGKSQFTVDPLFNGLMDEVLVTDYAMSAAQIAALQTNTPPQFTTALVNAGNAASGEFFTGTIAGLAVDSDAGDTLTYVKATGPAWLSVGSNGTLSGTPAAADIGTNYFTVRTVDSAGAGAFAVVTIMVSTLDASSVWSTDASGVWSNTNRWSNGIIANGAGQTGDFSAINITANRTVTLDTSRSIGTLKFGDTVGAQSWTLASSGGSVLTLNAGSATTPSLFVTNTATITAPLAGTNGFTKRGPGILVLGTNNPLSGTVNIDSSSTTTPEGTVRVASPGALAGASLIQIRNNNSGSSTLQLDGASGPVVVPANIALNGRNSAVAAIQNIAGTNTLSGNLTINVGGGNYWIQSDAGQLTLGGPISSGATGTRTFTFQGAGDIAVTGAIANGAASDVNVVKTGAGNLVLSGTNTYSGTTTVNGGTLLVNGSLGGGTVTVSSGTLGGDGAIGGPAAVHPGGILSPGAGAGAAIGRLTFGGPLTLAGATRMDLDKAAGTNDTVRGSSSIAYGGTLVLTNLGGTLTEGDAFQLFEATSFNGAFTSVVPVAPGPGLGWSTHTLASDGTLRIVRVVNTTPSEITSAISANSLTLSWPEDRIGWRLQVQTNSIGIGLSADWFDVPGSTVTNRLSLPIDPVVVSVFYRLVYP